jgi:hypothetical protein
MRALNHITLDTGDSAMVPAEHVQPKTREVLEPLVAYLAAEGVATIPIGNGAWRVTSEQPVPGRCLSAVIEYRSRREGGDTWVGVALLGVAGHSRCGADLWSAMHFESEPGREMLTRPDRQPATPWLATRLLAGVALVAREDIAWLADFSECLAWVWLLRGEV